jgi:hypothetical protein
MPTVQTEIRNKLKTIIYTITIEKADPGMDVKIFEEIKKELQAAPKLLTLWLINKKQPTIQQAFAIVKVLNSLHFNSYRPLTVNDLFFESK